jgi:hypothetical protein
MCFHRRLVFSCSHYAWLGVTQPCAVEESFNNHVIDTGCSVRWSHGHDTIRTQAKCPKCADAEESHNFRFGIVKDQIKVLKEHLKLIKGTTKIKDEEWLNKDSEQPEPDEPKDGDATDTSSLPVTPEESGAVSFDEGCGAGLEETREEVSADYKHRPLKLPAIVAARMATVQSE